MPKYTDVNITDNILHKKLLRISAIIFCAIGYVFMIIERKKYLDKLISKKDNGLIKVITGIRRCGNTVSKPFTIISQRFLFC